MEIRQYNESDGSSWQEFVDRQPGAWMYHLPGWKEVIEKAYGHRGIFLTAVDGGSVKGILPMVLIKSPIFGKSLTSMPYVDSAGLIAENEEARGALLTRATELIGELGADYLELRQTAELSGPLTTRTHKVTLVLDLPADAEGLWKALPSERRNRIRKAEKAGLSVEMAGRDMLGFYYRIWSENMRDIGSPAHSIGFFDHILRVFGANAGIVLVRYRSEYIGAAIALYYKDTLALPWVSSLRKHFDLYPNNILYWGAMKYAVERRYRYFDFGRSTIDSGTYTFKIRWGAKPKQLYWQFVSASADRPVPTGADDPKYNLAISLWKRLPVGVANFIGPSLRKHITA